MPHPADQIHSNAERLRALNSRINETVRHRSDSPAKRAEWQAACAEFHEQFDQLFFPGGTSGWSAFLANSAEGVELALLFLEVDQYTFRSGYHKQIVWDRLKKLHLAPQELQRLEETAIAYLHKRVRREFWHMVRFARLRASSSFWQRIERLAADEACTPVTVKARWLLLARRNLPVRQWIGRELFRPRYQPGYIPQLDFQVPAQHEVQLKR